MLARERGVSNQCTFLQCSAEKLEGIADGSVDVVTTRAVLAYVSDKIAALREFHRILKPGGRLSIAEPIFRDDAIEAIALRKMIDAQGQTPQDPLSTSSASLESRAVSRHRRANVQSPIANFSERDLVRVVNGLGFADIQLAFRIEIIPSRITSWDVFLGFSPHPWAPSLNVILANQFSPEERQLFEQILRPLVEARQVTTTDRIAYLTATKPPA